MDENLEIAAVITARLGSTRLDKKVTLDLAGQPLVSHVIERVKDFQERLSGTQRYEVVLAIPSGKKEDPLEEIGKRWGVKVFKGDEENVLSRVILAAESVRAGIVFRITGDNPLIDPGVVTETWLGFLDGEWDYAVMEDTPLGTTAEIVTLDALKRADLMATTTRTREHPTLALYENPDLFRMRLITPPDKWKRPDWRFTVDTEQDLQLVEQIILNLGKDATLERIIPWLELHPEVVKTNSEISQDGWGSLKDCKDAIGQR